MLNQRYRCAHFLLMGCAIMFACGCSGARVAPPPSDPSAAKSALERALNVWKSGEQITALRQSPEPCIVRDEDWEAGRVLKNFTLQPNGESFISDVRWMVQLEVTDAQGNLTSKSVRYTISLNPSCTIMRDDTTD